MSAPSRQYSVTILVNPDDYDSAAIESVSDEIWLWYLRPVGLVADSYLSSARRLYHFEANERILRQEFALKAGRFPNRLSIVSDQESFEFLVQSRVPTLMSPPPVSSATNHIAVGRPFENNFALLNPETMVSNLYMEALEEVKTCQLAQSWFSPTEVRIPNHLIVLPEGSFSTFHYGIAIGAVLRCRVLGPAVHTAWGLEPGLDYLQFSSPDELSWMVKHIVRFPNSTDLMARRIANKAGIFEAANVYERILNTKPELLDGLSV